MSLQTRHKVVWCVVVAGLCLPINMILFDALFPTNRAAAWVSSLSTGERDEATTRFFTYPQDYRRALFRGLSGQARANVRRMVIDELLRRFPELNDAQRADLVAVRGLFRDNVDEDRQALEKARDTVAAVIKKLSREQAAFLNEMGPRTALPPPSAFERAVSWVRRRQSLYANNYGDCTCSTASDYCDWTGNGPHCGGWPGWYCTIIPDSCGTFWSYDCNGWCVTS